jgi:hypothetical protein
MKRLVAGTLWGLVAMWMSAYVALFLGLPVLSAFPFALAVGAFVTVDPMNRIWPAVVVQSTVERSTPYKTRGLVRSS